MTRVLRRKGARSAGRADGGLASVGLLQRLLPGLGGEVEDVASRVGADPDEDVAEVVVRVDAVQPAPGEDRVQDAGPLGARLAAAKSQFFRLCRAPHSRRAWLFVGSDDDAQSAAHLFSLVASARLHGLDPEAYLRDLFRVLAHWPKDRHLELSPRYWAATRARLDTGELALEFGPLKILAPLPSTAEEK